MACCGANVLKKNFLLRTSIYDVVYQHMKKKNRNNLCAVLRRNKYCSAVFTFDLPTLVGKEKIKESADRSQRKNGKLRNRFLFTNFVVPYYNGSKVLNTRA